MSGTEITPLISALLTGLIGLFGTLAGVYYQRRSETHRQLVNQIYRPLYDELVEVTEGDLPFDTSDEQFRSYWTELDHYWHSRVDEDLQEQIERYTSLLDVADSVFYVIAEEIRTNIKLNDVISSTAGNGTTAYVDTKLLYRVSGGKKTHTSIVNWFESYSTAVLDATDVGELRENLEEQADSLSPEHRRAIDSFDDKHLKELGKGIKKADTEVDFPEGVSSTNELFEELRCQANILSIDVKNKLDSLVG
ncbi:hypothetical protein [Halorubrum ezzemoulense]|uniref:hypothetical protein n=1 Tax=Halorubrum ezzemoulense TaxID=337243 RepID=UPI001181C66B|nr:hypothetical protein [Halorubrum ezzemoulense]